MKSIITFILAMCLATGSAMAQNNERPQRTEWGHKMLELKHEMIQKELDMTPSQKEQFMPLYEAMGKEIYVVNREVRELERKVSAKSDATDDEYSQAAEAMSNIKAKESEIESKYFEKFSKILSKKQMFLLKRAENKFTREMVTRGKKNAGERKGGRK